jgi:copper chaperone
MKILKFKTNIENQESLNQVSSLLDQEEAISKWKVDTEDNDHLLSVSGYDLEPDIVKALVERAGYRAELIRVLGIGGEDV